MPHEIPFVKIFLKPTVLAVDFSFLIFLYINKYHIIKISSSASIFFCLAFLKFLF